PLPCDVRVSGVSRGRSPRQAPEKRQECYQPRKGFALVLRVTRKIWTTPNCLWTISNRNDRVWYCPAVRPRHNSCHFELIAASPRDVGACTVRAGFLLMDPRPDRQSSDTSSILVSGQGPGAKPTPVARHRRTTTANGRASTKHACMIAERRHGHAHRVPSVRRGGTSACWSRRRPSFRLVVS